MGNCLVTKLNGTVNNSSLSTLGAITLRIDTTGKTLNPDRKIGLFAGTHVEFDVKVEGTGTFDVVYANTTIQHDITEYHVPSWIEGTMYFIPSSGVYNLLIFSEYQLQRLDIRECPFIKMNIDELYYYDMQTVSLSPEIEGRLKFNTWSNIEYLILGGGNEHKAKSFVNLSDLSETSDLITIILNNSDSYGNIINLKNCTTLTSLNCPTTGLSGELTALAAAMAANRTSGELDCRLYNTNVTINEVPFNQAVAAGGGTYYAKIVFNSSSPDGYSIVYY